MEETYFPPSMAGQSRFDSSISGGRQPKTKIKGKSVKAIVLILLLKPLKLLISLLRNPQNIFTYFLVARK